MTKEFIKSNDAPPPGGAYSQAIKAGSIIFVSGQGPLDPKTDRRGPDIETQTSQTILNLKAILQAGGYLLEDVVKVTVFLKNSEDFHRMNRVYQTFFPKDPPARTTVVTNFVNADMLIEIDAIAYIEQKQTN